MSMKKSFSYGSFALTKNNEYAKFFFDNFLLSTKEYFVYSIKKFTFTIRSCGHN